VLSHMRALSNCASRSAPNVGARLPVCGEEELNGDNQPQKVAADSK